MSQTAHYKIDMACTACNMYGTLITLTKQHRMALYGSESTLIILLTKGYGIRLLTNVLYSACVCGEEVVQSQLVCVYSMTGQRRQPKGRDCWFAKPLMIALSPEPVVPVELMKTNE